MAKKKKKAKKIPAWLLWAGSIVGVLTIISVIADGCSLLDRFWFTETSIPREEMQIEDSQVIVIGDGSVISGPVQLNPYDTPMPTPTKDARLYNVEIEGQNENVIVAFNRKRESLWQQELDTRVRVARVDDVNQDGSQEVIAATYEPGARPGWLLVFDELGNLIDEHNTWKPSIYYGGAKPQMNIGDFRVVDLTNDGTKEIVILSKDVYWYASRLSVLQFRGRTLEEVAEYWNPGILRTLHIADTNNDQIQEVVCMGENNDLQAVYPLGGNVFVVFLFDGSAIFGQAPPGFGEASRGSEAWYGYVEPSSIWITEVNFEDFDGDGAIDVHVALSDSCSFFVDYEGNVVGRGRGSGCKGESDLRILH